MTSRLFMFALIVGGCVNDATSSGKMTGEEGGPCFMDATCKTGLVCVVPNMCVKPDSGSSNDGSTSMDSMTSMDSSMGSDSMTVMDGSTSDAASQCVGSTMAFWKFDGNAMANVGPSLTPMGTLPYQQAKVNLGAQTGNGYLVNMANPAFSGVSVMSVEMWIRNDSSSASGRILNYLNTMSGVPIWTVYVSNFANTIDVSITSSGIVTGVSLPTDNTFHHLAFTYDGSNIFVYLDGNVFKSNTAQNPIPNYMQTAFSVGADPNGTSPFKGVIDELAIYKTALSANQIKAIYNAGASGYCRTP